MWKQPINNGKSSDYPDNNNETATWLEPRVEMIVGASLELISAMVMMMS